MAYQPADRGRVPPAPAFIGRERELAAVRAALADPPVLVLVEGEAGIGKTRLVQECLAAPAWPGGSVLEAICPPLREPFPLGSVVDALHRLGPPEPAGLSPLAGALRPLLPEWADHLPPAPEALEDPKATRHRLLRALAELLPRLGVAVLVVEDAHWADATTLELLLTLAAGDPALSLVVTYRPPEVPAGSLLRRLAAGSSGPLAVVRAAPAPLSRAETRALVASMFVRTQVAEELVALLHERTQGVPLALVESLALLGDRGDLAHARAAAELQVPPTVRDSVLERVARLDPAARRVLAAAAVLAEPADELVLARVTGLGERRTRQGVARGLTSGLLCEAGPARFVPRHVLAARAIEEAVPASERRRLHHRAGTALQQLGNPAPARLSRHFREAGEVAEWSRYAEAAADLALTSGDDRAAVLALLELLTTTQPPPQRRDLLARKLGEAAAGGAAALGDLGPQVTEALRAVLADGADGAGEARAHAEIRLLLGRLLLQWGEHDDACAQIEAALHQVVDQPVLAARAMMSLAFPRGHAWPAARHLGWLERATGLLSQVPAGPERTLLAVDRATALLLLGEEAGWQAAAEIGEDAPTLAERRQVARSLMNAGHMAILWGRYGHARRQLEAAVRLMRSTGYQRLLGSARLTTAYLDWNTGAWQGLAERVTALAGAEDTLPEAQLEAGLILALLDLAGGARDAAEQRLREVLAEATRRGLVDTQMSPAAALGRLYLVEDDAAEAVRVTTPGIDLIARKGVWLWATDIAPVHVDALVRAGQRGAAKALVAALPAGLTGSTTPAPAAALLTCQALVADPDQAAARFAAAARAWSTLPRPYEELLATERRGHCLLAAGERDRGLAVLRQAQARLATLGARWDADRVAMLLRRHGVEVARTWRGGRRGYGDQLSPREREVARLVARGLTNRQVAEALFVSPRTVDHHLSGAMHKLGVASRTALAVAVSEQNLRDPSVRGGDNLRDPPLRGGDKIG